MQRARAELQPFHCGLRHRSETTAPRPGSIPSRPSPFRVDSARIQWFPSSRKSGKSGSKHKNDLQEARSARLASSQVSSPHASRTCTCLAHTHSLRPRRMSTHAQHVGFSRVVDAFCIATMRRAACSMHSICPARDPYASRAHSRSIKTSMTKKVCVGRWTNTQSNSCSVKTYRKTGKIKQLTIRKNADGSKSYTRRGMGHIRRLPKKK